MIPVIRYRCIGTDYSGISVFCSGIDWDISVLVPLYGYIGIGTMVLVLVFCYFSGTGVMRCLYHYIGIIIL